MKTLLVIGGVPSGERDVFKGSSEAVDLGLCAFGLGQQMTQGLV